MVIESSADIWSELDTYSQTTSARQAARSKNHTKHISEAGGKVKLITMITWARYAVGSNLSSWTLILRAAKLPSASPPAALMALYMRLPSMEDASRRPKSGSSIPGTFPSFFCVTFCVCVCVCLWVRERKRMIVSVWVCALVCSHVCRAILCSCGIDYVFAHV